MADPRYEINGRAYTQRELVLGQLLELLGAVAGLAIVELSVAGVLAGVGDRLPSLLAIVLIPEGQGVEQRDLRQAEDDLRSAPLSLLLRMVTDFFAVTRPSSLLSDLAGVIETVGGEMNAMTPLLPSLNGWSAPSPAATSANDPPSSGG